MAKKNIVHYPILHKKAAAGCSTCGGAKRVFNSATKKVLSKSKKKAIDNLFDDDDSGSSVVKGIVESRDSESFAGVHITDWRTLTPSKISRKGGVTVELLKEEITGLGYVADGDSKTALIKQLKKIISELEV